MRMCVPVSKPESPCMHTSPTLPSLPSYYYPTVTCQASPGPFHVASWLVLWQKRCWLERRAAVQALALLMSRQQQQQQQLLAAIRHQHQLPLLLLPLLEPPVLPLPMPLLQLPLLVLRLQLQLRLPPSLIH